MRAILVKFMRQLILQAFYFVLPAYLANMAPVIFDKFGWLKFLNKPIDAGQKLGREFIFGRGKTWRGIVAGVIGGVLMAFGQSWLYHQPLFSGISLFDYSSYWLMFGFLAGLGALVGDLFKSFVKRRVGIESGKPWLFFDQLDFIFGFLIFTYWLAHPSFAIIIIIALLTLILHPLTNITAFFLRIKRVWW